MQSKFRDDTRVIIHHCALGSKNDQLKFNIVEHATSSSFFQPSKTNHKYHPGEMEITQNIEVAVVRLDSVVDGDIDILKLDLQGYELEALRGCGDLLTQIKTITTEVEFISLYEGQPLFADIDSFLRENGFRLYNLYDLWTQDDGQLTAGDAVYLNMFYFD
jgi:FkbM family methyltransferase